MKLVLISDTHGLHQRMPHPLPAGDILVHCGDISNVGKPAEILDFLDWFSSQPHQHKVFIAGNHDFGLEVKHPEVEEALANLPSNVHYLQDSGVEIDGVKFWGMPWTPKFYNWAFMTWTEVYAAEKAGMIPDDTEVLITHGPPLGTLDVTRIGGYAVGCEELAKRIEGLPGLRLHAFGHIHEEYGTEWRKEILCVNASTCTPGYAPTNPPILVERSLDSLHQPQYTAI